MNRAGTPFRWDVASTDVVRRMGRGLRGLLPRNRRQDLLRCAAKVVAEAGDTDLVFVGRSPESIHDFLRGAFAGTSYQDRVQLLQLSLRDHPRRLRHERPDALQRLRLYIEAAGLGPRQIVARPRPVAFVDLVCSGDTFGYLSAALRQFTAGDLDLWTAVRERLRWVCLVSDEPGWHAWEPGDSRWTREFHGSRVRRLMIDGDFWHYLGDEQEKTTESYSVEAWGSERAETDLDGYRFEAVRLARAIFRLGECWRRRLASKVERLRESRPSEPWLGLLVDELRKGRP